MSCMNKTIMVGFVNTFWLITFITSKSMLGEDYIVKGFLISFAVVLYVCIFLWTGVLRADLGFVKSDAIKHGMIPRVVMSDSTGELFIATKYRMSSDRKVIAVNKYLMRSEDIKLVRDSS
jgi:hypothetical protein